MSLQEVINSHKVCVQYEKVMEIRYKTIFQSDENSIQLIHVIAFMQGSSLLS